MKLMIDQQDRRLDSMLICGEHVSIGEFKCDPKHIFHAIGQILGYEQILLKTEKGDGQNDGQYMDYKERWEKGNSSKFVAFEEEPDDFSMKLCEQYGIRVWWEGLDHVPCGPVPYPSNADPPEVKAVLEQWQKADDQADAIRALKPKVRSV